jgi:methionyl-tRNA formyltransferase
MNKILHNKNKTKIVFMGSPYTASLIMESLIEQGYQVIALITQPDQPIGNNRQIPATKKLALKYQIPVYQPDNIKKQHSFIDDIKCDLVITVAYGQIVPQDILDWPRLGCINVHGSLLPQLRGAAPLQHALINGMNQTGLCLTKMVLSMDAGPIYASDILPIKEDDNYSTLLERFTCKAIDLLKEKLPLLINGELKGIEQNEQDATFAHSIKREQEHLDINLESLDFINWIKALADSPGGYLVHETGKLKIFKAVIDNKAVTCGIGTIVKADKQGLVLQLKDGQIRLLTVQKEGRKRLDYRDFINGEPTLVSRVYK